MKIYIQLTLKILDPWIEGWIEGWVENLVEEYTEQSCQALFNAEARE